MVVGSSAVVPWGERRNVPHRDGHGTRDRNELDRDIRTARAGADDDHVGVGELVRVSVRTRVDDPAAETIAVAKRWLELADEQAARHDDRVERLAVHGPRAVPGGGAPPGGRPARPKGPPRVPENR